MSKQQIIALIFVISLLGTLGSLYIGYFGDPLANLLNGDLRNLMNGKAACTLCWYIRICLFPMTLISGVAYKYKDASIWRYILPLAAIGLFFSVYVYGIEMKRWAKSEGLCGFTNTVSCGDPAILWGGWFTLGTAGILSFIIIIGASVYLRKKYIQHKS